MQPTLTPELLNEKLQTLLHQLICIIESEMGKILHGEITQIGECTDALETKCHDLVQYVQALEEENSALNTQFRHSKYSRRGVKICVYRGSQELWVTTPSIPTYQASLIHLLPTLLISIGTWIVFIDLWATCWSEA